MPRQLPADCLSEIFEYLEDKVDLYSCLLVDHLWCEVSVRFLWTNIQNFHTLIACLPDESKEILYENEIIISPSTSKPPLFNYVTFIKNLSMTEIRREIRNLLEYHQPTVSQRYMVVTKEIFKMFMSQISLKKLTLYYNPRYIQNIPNIPFTTYPGAIDCLRNLSELICYSDIYPEIFYQLSQICYNIQSLNLTIRNFISNGLTNLISVQQNLKYLIVYNESNNENLTDIISPLKKISSNLIKLDINIPLPFIDEFTNLKELVLHHHECLKLLQYVKFPQLQILNFIIVCPYHEHFIKFLENNGKNLKEIYLPYVDDNSTNLAIAKFCPNLRSLCTVDEIETLKVILNSCQELESVEVWCGNGYLNETELLEVVAKHSPKKFYELKIFNPHDFQSVLFSETEKLESAI